MNETLSEKTTIVQEQTLPDQALFGKPQFIFFGVMLMLVLFDQLTKIWATNNLNMYQPLIIIGNHFRLVLVHNKGLIWGIPIKNIVSYYVLPIVGMIFVLYLGMKVKSKFSAVGYGFIISGAIGNLIDRIRLGYVVDFIDMGVNNTRWATYNIADAAIVIGLCLILAKEIFGHKNQSKEK